MCNIYGANVKRMWKNTYSGSIKNNKESLKLIYDHYLFTQVYGHKENPVKKSMDSYLHRNNRLNFSGALYRYSLNN